MVSISNLRKWISIFPEMSTCSFTITWYCIVLEKSLTKTPIYSSQLHCRGCCIPVNSAICPARCRLSLAVRWSSAQTYVRGLPFKSICDQHMVSVNIWGHPTLTSCLIYVHVPDVTHKHTYSTHVQRNTVTYITWRHGTANSTFSNAFLSISFP